MEAIIIMVKNLSDDEQISLLRDLYSFADKSLPRDKMLNLYLKGEVKKK